jgi:hypothetical protein
MENRQTLDVFGGHFIKESVMTEQELINLFDNEEFLEKVSTGAILEVMSACLRELQDREWHPRRAKEK